MRGTGGARRIGFAFENAARKKGFRSIAGVDEAGRGCLAGPVVAAAVILDPRRPVHGIDDSKRLRPEARERVAKRIRERALAFSVAAVGNELIDRGNILRATLDAMRRAAESLDPRADFLLIDGISAPRSRIPAACVVRGDARSFSIAAASILAKVERDRMMAEFDREFPGYGFAAHKGYPTPEHRDALRRLGPCTIHRLTFRGVQPEEAVPRAQRLLPMG